MEKRLKVRQIKDKLFTITMALFSAAIILPLFFIIFYIVRNGAAEINWNFITSLPKPVGETGGISNAIIGTIELIGIATLIGVPLALFAGIYIKEFEKNKLARAVSSLADILQGVPSIVIGIVCYLWIVLPLKSFSLLSGSVALAIMMQPMIIKSTYHSLKLVPDSLKEASLALGTPYYKTVMKVMVPAASSGIITGIILSISRIAGETAPLLFTAFGNPFMNLNVTKPVNSLPLLIFNYATSPFSTWQKQAWGASLILIILVSALNLISKIMEHRWKTIY